MRIRKVFEQKVPRRGIRSFERLTEALRRSGGVGAVRVGNVTVMNSLKKLRSHTLRLRLDYEGPAVDAPSSVIYFDFLLLADKFRLCPQTTSIVATGSANSAR
jgi:hypothetical protein